MAFILHKNVMETQRLNPPKTTSCVLAAAVSVNHNHERSRWTLTFAVSDLRSVTVKEEGWTFMVFRLKESSTSLPALHFHQGGSDEFLDSLRRFVLLCE